MPIYEYKCTNCGFQKEYLRKVSDPAETDCPSCGQATFSKMVTAAGFQLKGTGWYVTDFRNSGGAPAADSGTSRTSTKASDAAPGDSAGASSTGTASSTGDSAAPAAAPAAAAGASSAKADTPSA